MLFDRFEADLLLELVNVDKTAYKRTTLRALGLGPQIDGVKLSSTIGWLAITPAGSLSALARPSSCSPGHSISPSWHLDVLCTDASTNACIRADIRAKSATRCKATSPEAHKNCKQYSRAQQEEKKTSLEL
jgi:hypothetical protein